MCARERQRRERKMWKFRIEIVAVFVSAEKHLLAVLKKERGVGKPF